MHSVKDRRKTSVGQCIVKLSVGTEEDGGVVVNADGGIIKENVQSRGRVLACTSVPFDKGFELIRLIGEPGGVITRFLQNEGEMLSEARLVGVFYS